MIRRGHTLDEQISEERGQSEAIAKNLFEMAGLRVPVICIVIGEGGSGGALGLGVGNHLHMLENSTYSVISPEGAAALLWKDSSLAKKAKRNNENHCAGFKRIRYYRSYD